jgi:hypothetical protein
MPVVSLLSTAHPFVIRYSSLFRHSSFVIPPPPIFHARVAHLRRRQRNFSALPRPIPSTSTPFYFSRTIGIAAAALRACAARARCVSQITSLLLFSSAEPHRA